MGPRTKSKVENLESELKGMVEAVVRMRGRFGGDEENNQNILYTIVKLSKNIDNRLHYQTLKR